MDVNESLEVIQGVITDIQVYVSDTKARVSTLMQELDASNDTLDADLVQRTRDALAEVLGTIERVGEITGEAPVMALIEAAVNGAEVNAEGATEATAEAEVAPESPAPEEG